MKGRKEDSEGNNEVMDALGFFALFLFSLRRVAKTMGEKWVVRVDEEVRWRRDRRTEGTNRRSGRKKWVRDDDEEEECECTTWMKENKR